MNIIQNGGMYEIDRDEIDGLIAEKKFIGLNKEPRDEKVIISLTTFPPRIHSVKYTIYSLLNQNFPADKLILWLAEDEFPRHEKDLPQDLLNMKKFGLSIEYCENLKSYKKLIPALEKYPNDAIVTADDDIFYLPDWLKIIYDEHVKYPQNVIACRARRIMFDSQANIFPYEKWSQSSFRNSHPPLRLVITTYSQVPEEFFSRKNFFTRI